MDSFIPAIPGISLLTSLWPLGYESVNVQKIAYAQEDPENQYLRIHSPINIPPGNCRVCVIYHGGYFKSCYSLDNSLINTVAPFLASQGWVAIEVEYRRVGNQGGGWPGTNNDVISSLQFIHELSTKPEYSHFDMNRVTILGHSAGGTLALWACGQIACKRIKFTPQLCVAIAPIPDLEEGHRLKLSDEGTAIFNYMGGKEPTPSSSSPPPPGVFNFNSTASGPVCPWSLASPSKQLPLCSKKLFLVVGSEDKDVPPSIVTSFHQKCNEVIKALPGGVGPYARMPPTTLPARLEVMQGVDHFEVVNAGSAAWAKIYGWILEELSQVEK